MLEVHKYISFVPSFVFLDALAMLSASRRPGCDLVGKGF